MDTYRVIDSYERETEATELHGALGEACALAAQRAYELPGETWLVQSPTQRVENGENPRRWVTRYSYKLVERKLGHAAARKVQTKH